MKILLTRPERDSKKLALKIEKSKHTIEIAPLIRIIKIKSNEDINVNNFSAIIFI